MSVGTYEYVIKALDIFQQNSSWEVSREENMQENPFSLNCVYSKINIG
jgi:hypothetical protein